MPKLIADLAAHGFIEAILFPLNSLDEVGLEAVISRVEDEKYWAAEMKKEINSSRTKREQGNAASKKVESPIDRADELIERDNKSNNTRDKQALFRQKTLTLYENKCAICGWAIKAALEAAHIEPYKNMSSHFAANSLLLRADLHALFDRLLFSIEPGTFEIITSRPLIGTPYEALLSGKVTPPKGIDIKLFNHQLRIHFEDFKKKNPQQNLD